MKQTCGYQNCNRKRKYTLYIEKKKFVHYCEEHLIDVTNELKIKIPINIYQEMSTYGKSQIKKKEL